MGTLDLEAFKYKVYSYKVFFSFKGSFDYQDWNISSGPSYTVLYKERHFTMNSNFPVLIFESTDKLTEKQIRKDFHNSQFISKIEGDLRLPVKEALKTFKI